jgi:hypothetical protein
MAAAYLIVYEWPVEGLDVFRSETLAREVGDLNWTAAEIGVRPLSEFCGSAWFDAAEGLRSVQTLRREISAWSTAKETAGILSDLQECERVLYEAGKLGVRWHFEMNN